MADLSAFVRSPFGTQCVHVSLAALASAVAALMICALLPPAISPAPPAVHHADQAAAAQRAAPRLAGFDVGKAWSEDYALLHVATHPELRTARTDLWSPAGGVSVLLATRFPSAAQVATETAGANTPSTDDLRTAEARTGAAVPLPPSAPAVRRDDSKRTATARTTPQVASLPPQAPEPGYFEFFRKLFEGPDHAAEAMLVANPKTAIYDIQKRVVYLPDGEKLEAHSGYGKWKDDPTSVKRKNLGVTPPNVYRVTFRAKLFHGVRALRLTPIDGGKMYGRDGMLAHPYMLGDGGQSNGCVSVKNYQKFLQAYEDGDFKQLIVVRSVDQTKPSQVASAAPGNV